MIPLNSRLSLLKRSPIRQFTALAAQTPGCILLTLGEPDGDTPEPVRQAAVSALDRGRTHYAPNQGVEALRTAIARQENCTPAQVLVTAGATQALYTALTGILNPGEEVVIPVPAFNLYETIVTAAGGVPVTVSTAETDFQLTDAMLEKVITPKTKAIVLNSPSNPTGSMLTQASLDAVRRAVIGKPIFVIWDDVYRLLSYEDGPSLRGDPELADQLLLCQSFSKPWAMTGWRVGYLTGPEDVISQLLLLHAAQVAAVPTFLQDACQTALQEDISDMRETYRARRDYVSARLKNMGLTFPEPKGAFYIFPDISRYKMDSDTFCRTMIRQARVAAVPGSCFGGEGHIRISYAASMENLVTAMDRMEAFLKTL